MDFYTLQTPAIAMLRNNHQHSSYARAKKKPLLLANIYKHSVQPLLLNRAWLLLKSAFKASNIIESG
ncbi:MAG: hypothetical protein MR782_02450 [Campylobacter sp.]|nr:hypothetical protein [Campylobacter sp.]